MSGSNDKNNTVSLRSDDAKRVDKINSSSLSQFNDKGKNEDESNVQRGLFIVI
jgi:hypothetical protein